MGNIYVLKHLAYKQGLINYAHKYGYLCDLQLSSQKDKTIHTHTSARVHTHTQNSLTLSWQSTSTIENQMLNMEIKGFFTFHLLDQIWISSQRLYLTVWLSAGSGTRPFLRTDHPHHTATESTVLPSYAPFHRNEPWQTP